MAKYTPLGQRGKSKSGDSGKSSGDLKHKLTANNAGSNSTSSGVPASNPYAGSSTQAGNMGNYQKGKTPGTAAPMPQNTSSSGDLGKSSGDLQQYKPPPSDNTASGAPTQNPYSGSSTQPGDVDSYQKDQDLSNAQRMQPKKPVYDDQNGSNGSFDPSLYNNSGTNTATGAPSANPYSQSSTQPDVPDSYSKKPIDSNGLGDREKAAASGAVGAVGKAEKGLIGSGLNKADKFLPPQARAVNMVRKIFSNKKKSAAGLVVAALATILIFLFSIGSGPLKLIHLSQLLQKNFFGMEKSSSLRMKGLFRYARTGDVGETRVSRLGSEVFKKTITKMEKIGFDFSDRASNGHLKSVTIDPNKHPAFKDLDPAERRAAIIKHFDIKDSGILSGSGNAFKINLDATTVKGMDFARSLTGTAVGDLQNGKTLTGMGARSMNKFYNQGKSLFSPLDNRLKASQNKRTLTKDQKRAAEKERVTKINDSASSSPKAVEARDKIKGKISGKGVALGVAGSALVMTDALCIVRDVSDAVVVTNRAATVVPAALQAIDKTAVGAQAQSGDLGVRDAGQVADSLVDDDGKDIFGAKAMQALSGKPKPSGEDLSYDYKQAFSNNTTAQNIKDSIGSPTLLGIDFGGAACSTAGQIVQGALSLGIAFGAILTAIPSGGTSVLAVIGKTGASAAASAGVLYLLQKQFVKLLASKVLVPELMSGPLGGNLLAYGGREAGNIAARASGGIALSASSALVLDQEQEQESRQEFQSKSFASRMFDVYDHRSLAGNIIDSTNSEPGEAIAHIASSLTNVSSLSSGLFSAFTPKVAADEEPYDWGFPRYGIPAFLIDHPEFEDPYANATRAAQLLDGATVSGASTSADNQILGASTEQPGSVLGISSDDYVGRARACFGVEISKESGVWDAVAVEEVNPNEQSYIDANCDDPRGEWKRIYMFVLDTRLLTAVACHEDDLESCANLDSGSGGPATAPSGSDSGPTVSGDAQASAQTLLDLAGQGKIALDGYSSDPASDKADGSLPSQQLKDIASGKPAKGTTRCSYPVSPTVTPDPKLLQFLADLGQNYKYTINSLFGQCHSAGSQHHEGKAVDFGCPFDTSKGDVAGSKYGVSRNGENCGVDDHYHYSVGAN